MNALRKLKDVQPNKPYHGFARLEEGHHKIVSFRIVKNKFGKKAEGSGKSVLVELSEEVLFLPQYFGQKIGEDDVRELNTSIDKGESIYLFFGGRADLNR